MSDRRFDEDEPFSGLTARQTHGMIGKMLRESNGQERWKIRDKDSIAEFCEEQAMNETQDVEIRLQAVDRILRMESMNMEQQKLQIQVELAVLKASDPGEAKNEGPQIILVLPSNGSEVCQAT
jgi:hypothetical protein